MGSCASKPSREWMNDNYYDPDEDWHHGDQSWQFYRAEDINIYDSEFQPEPPKRTKSTGFRGKIQSLRKSFFNQGNSLENTPKVLRRESKGFKGKLESWRRSWFGSEPSPKPSRKLSLSQTLFGSKEEPVVRREKKFSTNRLSVTGSFVEKHSNGEEVYRKTSKPTLTDEVFHESEISPQIKGRDHPDHAPAMASRSTSDDIEEKISECKIQNRNAEREFLAKIKEIGSFDYGYDSDEDVTRLSHALRSPNKNSVAENRNGTEQKDRKKQVNGTSEREEEIMEEAGCSQEDQSKTEKPAMKDQCKPVDGEKLEEGLALFNDEYASEDEKLIQRIKEEKEEINRKNSSVRTRRDIEENDDKSTASEEEHNQEPQVQRTNTKSTVIVNSSASRRGGATIQISSKGRT